jgi:selenophosphate synthase
LNFGLQGNRSHWKVKTLFDPQTCGGLLLACESQKTERILGALREHHFDESAVIGEVVSSEESRPKITLV